MINEMKKYDNPMLQVVGIDKRDIIVTSLNVNNEAQNNLEGAAPGMRGLNDWDAGY